MAVDVDYGGTESQDVNMDVDADADGLEIKVLLVTETELEGILPLLYIYISVPCAKNTGVSKVLNHNFAEFIRPMCTVSLLLPFACVFRLYYIPGTLCRAYTLRLLVF